MNKHYKIAMATDYSVSVMNAERYATELAKAMQAELTLMHVYHEHLPQATNPAELAMNERSYRDMNLEYLQKHASKLGATVGDGAGTYSCVVRQGDVGRQVTDYACQNSIDLIVTGTHGHKGLRDRLLGTHTWNIIRQSRVPVMAVPESALYTGIQKIAFATDFRKAEIPVIQYAARLAAQFGASLTVVHINDEVLSRKYEAELFEEFKATVEKEVHYPVLDFVLTEESDDVSEALNTFCMDNQIDLLVMSPEKTFALERLLVHNPVSRDMSLVTKVPFLCVPEYHETTSRFYTKLLETERFISSHF